MNSIRVNKEELIAKLEKNREHHRAIFLEAQVVYRAAVIIELDNMLTHAREGRKIRRSVTLVEPSDHTKDYDRIIGMLMMSQDADINLSEHDYQCYVLDSWGWKEQFLHSNSSYSTSALVDYVALQEEDQ